jgi:PleD family two-component response regulator
VHGIVVARGGTITVESVERLGTTVNVWLPQIDPHQRPKKPAASLARHALVVDDDPAVGRLLQMALQRAHYDARLFTTAREALDAVTAEARSAISS